MKKIKQHVTEFMDSVYFRSWVLYMVAYLYLFAAPLGFLAWMGYEVPEYIKEPIGIILILWMMRAARHAEKVSGHYVLFGR